MSLLTGTQKKNIYLIVSSILIYSILELIVNEKQRLYPLVIIIVIRYFFLAILSRDSRVSWEKSSNKFFLKKIQYSFLSFVLYGSILVFVYEMNVLFVLADFSLFTLMLVLAASIKKASMIKSTDIDKEVAIYGAGTAGVSLYNSLIDNGILVKCFIDDDRMVRQNTVDSIKVISLDAFLSTEKFKNIDEVIIAMPSLSNKEILNKYELLGGFGGGIRMLPPLDEILSDRSLFQHIENISLDKFLTRQSRQLDLNAISKFIEGKIILISGAGGTIGSELVRQCINAKAKLLILLDHSEYNLYEICEEVTGFCIVPVLLSTTKREDVGKVISKYRPDVVLHAAAYKHVPLCEENIDSAIKNNIVGTINLIDKSIAYNVKDFVLISTDKAVRPTNVMGCTKRICELYGQNVEPKSTNIMSVRFGNVLGSSGSVIPKFIKQINSGGPVTVTHPDITRYFMLTSEACGLVLQAASSGKGGVVYILDMGEPVKIVDLARQMIALSGNENISVTFTGLRPGEKLYEELLLDDRVDVTSCKQIMIAKNTSFSIKLLNDLISNLLESDNKILALKRIVPEFNHKLN